MVEVTEARITQADIAAAAVQAGKHYQTAYDYEMDLRQSYATHREAAAKAERDKIVSWLLRAPDDWPFRGGDIANLILGDMPEWIALENTHDD